MARPFRVALLAVAVFALLAATPRAQNSPTIAAAALKAQIEGALATAPRNYERLLPPDQAGVRILNVEVSAAAQGAATQGAAPPTRIAIDLSQRALTYDPSGNIEPLLDQIIQSTASLVGTSRTVDYHFTVDGLPLDQFLQQPSPAPAPSVVEGRPSVRRSLAAGGTILISPGHGWYWDEALGTWHFQRPRINGIVEDLVNWDIARYVRDELLGVNIDAQMARYAEQDQAAGASGNARWQEAAKYFIQSLGAPPEVWNVGADDYARDINSRPFYANAIDAAAVVAIHNNGGQETGTETWYDQTNGQQDESRRLAEIVNRHVVSAIRARYSANWVDRGLRTCDGFKGENRLASRPAVLVEIAYMDTSTPDNAALHDDGFKRIVAQAIREAIEEWAST